MIRALAFAICLLSSALAKDVVVTLHVIELKQPALSALLSKNLAGEALVAEIRRMVSSKAARFYDTCLLRCAVGSRAATESTSELIYPTESEPGGLSYSEDYLKQAPEWWRSWLFMPVMAGFTGEFESRDFGEAFEISLRDPSSITGSPWPFDGEWALDLTSRKEDTVHFEMPMADGQQFKSRFPQFQRLELNGKGFTRGSWRPVGVTTKPENGGDPGGKLLTIMRVQLLKDSP